MQATRVPWLLVVCLLSAMVAPGRLGEAASIAVVTDPSAPPIERDAAEELCGYLGKLYGIEVKPTDQMPADADAAFVVGRPQSNAATGEAVRPGGWPRVTDQGIVLKRAALAGKPVLLVGGGSPTATLWAVYDLVERLGGCYLVDRDVLPPQQPWPGLPELDLVREPNVRIRCWRLVNDLADGPVSWSLEENRRFLRQMAKMKYNRVHVSLWPSQPFVHYAFRGVEKPPGTLFFGESFPIDDDTIGRERFGSMAEFTNPELAGARTPQEIRQCAIALVRGILAEARRLGMETGLSIQPFEWPREFIRVVPGAEPANQLGSLTAGPGAGQSMDDPILQDMVATVFRAHLETYPDVDYVIVGAPEHRSWVGQAETAYNRLKTRYDLASLGTLEELSAAARGRTTFPGGGERVERMLRGDLAMLCFFDCLVRERDLLARPGGGADVKLVYNGMVAELFPLVAQMLPPGGEVLSFIDYTASRQLRQRDLLRRVPPSRVPATLTFTLADDNVGVLPQLATGSLHAILGEMRQHRWAGFYTRFWTVSDLDPTIHYLARASWDWTVTPEAAYADQVRRVCGAESVEPALRAFATVEQLTLRLDEHGLGFGFPVPDMMTKHYDAGGLSEELRGVHRAYREALGLMEEAHARCRPEGRAYTGYFVGRLRFAVRYLDAAEEFGATGRELRANRPAEAKRHVDAAYQAIRDALGSYASVARDHGDLGAVALMNKYCYRPIRDKRNRM